MVFRINIQIRGLRTKIVVVKETKSSLRSALVIGFFLGFWGIISATSTHLEGSSDTFSILINYSLMMSIFPAVAMVGAYASSNLGLTKSDAFGSAIISSTIGNVLAQLFGFLIIVVSVYEDISASELSESILSVTSLVIAVIVGFLAGLFRVLVTSYNEPDQYFDETVEELEVKGPATQDTTKRIVMQVIEIERRLTDVETTVKSERLTNLLYGQR